MKKSLIWMSIIAMMLNSAFVAADSCVVFGLPLPNLMPCDSAQDTACLYHRCWNGVCTAYNSMYGTPCQGDTGTDSFCTKDICDGDGSCSHPADMGKNLMVCLSSSTSCQENRCEDGLCVNSATNDGKSCENDGVQCTQDVCDAGTCRHFQIPPPCDCSVIGEGNPCQDDGNECTDNICESGVCVAEGNNNFCRIQDSPCNVKQCSPVSKACELVSGGRFQGITCPDDGNPCTLDVCSVQGEMGPGTCTHDTKDENYNCPQDSNLCDVEMCLASGNSFTCQSMASDRMDGYWCEHEPQACSHGHECRSGVCTYFPLGGDNCVPEFNKTPIIILTVFLCLAVVYLVTRNKKK